MMGEDLSINENWVRNEEGKDRILKSIYSLKEN